MTKRRKRAMLAVLALLVPGCEEPAKPNPKPASKLVVLAPEPPTMECRFEPVSASSKETAKSGAQLCFSSGEATPWWSQYTTDAGAREPAPTAPEDATDAAEAVPPPCPPEMVLVEGEYCPKVLHKCLRYIDDQGPGGFLSHHRCALYEQPAECLAEREHRRFCIDRDEYTASGEKLPLVEQSWTLAKELCESQGKRLCFESEWQFACEGQSMLPYPYGYERDAKRCNHDLTNLSRRGKLRDLRVPSDDRPECVSPFGVRNMVGNVDEWTYRDDFIAPWRASLRGGWWLAGRNNCVAATTGHDEYYHGPQTGVRCCANAR